MFRFLQSDSFTVVSRAKEEPQEEDLNLTILTPGTCPERENRRMIKEKK